MLITNTIPDPIEASQKSYQVNEKTTNKLLGKTLFTRIDQQDLNPSGPSKKADFVVGLHDEKLMGRVETDHLRRVPLTTFQRIFGITAFGVAGLGYFIFNHQKQGIVVKELTKAAAALTAGELNHLPLIPRLTFPILTSLGSYYFETITHHPALAFSFLSSVAVIALLGRRIGKGFTKGTIAGNPNCLGGSTPRPDPLSVNFNDLPMLGEESFSDNHEKKVLLTLPVESIEDASFENRPRIEVSKEDGHLYHQLKIGEKSFSAVRIGEDDDDDDDDDMDVKETKKGPSTLRKTAVLGTAGFLTVASAYFLGEGLTTAAFTTLLSAPVKADFRLKPWLNGYALLCLGAASLLSLREIAPFVSSLAFIPITIAASKALKELKDCNTGKRPKNPYWFSVPTSIQRTYSKLTGWKPFIPDSVDSPFLPVLEKENKKAHIKVDLNATDFDTNNSDQVVPLQFKITGGKLSAKYKIDKKMKKSLFGLAKVKPKKSSKLRDGLFLGSFGVATLASSYLTQNQSAEAQSGVRSSTETEGEGVITNLLNGTLTSSTKQTGKKTSPKRLYGTMAVSTILANGAENTLLHFKVLPFRFAGIVNSMVLATVSKMSKNWIYGKPYFKKKKVKSEKV
ncbi:MAG: hypothetical protein K1000chlam2_01063 [Chlamydiae bacterium]|nr:hypothetical protein [Chlamydiota bacterium]